MGSLSSSGIGDVDAGIKVAETAIDRGAGCGIGSRVGAEFEVGSEAKAGNECGPASRNPAGGLRGSRGPEGIPEGAGKVLKMRNMASLNT